VAVSTWAITASAAMSATGLATGVAAAVVTVRTDWSAQEANAPAALMVKPPSTARRE
jgi:hypothetical protein